MASMKQIKKRKHSVDSTGKITKAMKLVATVKLQKVKQQAMDAVPYFDAMYATMVSVLKHTKDFALVPKTVDTSNAKKALVVFSSNKGLAGGYNSSIVKKILTKEEGYDFNPLNTLIYAVGSKARDELARRGFTIEKDYSDEMEDIHFASGIYLMEQLEDDIKVGKINEVYVIYTHFKNTITHIPRILKLLPFDRDRKDRVFNQETELIEDKNYFSPYVSKFDGDEKMPMTYEIDEVDMLNALIPKYLSAIFFGGLVFSTASENGARMTAMDNATKNAEDLSDRLGKMYNRARQGAITQEITEIVAGANAI